MSNGLDFERQVHALLKNMGFEAEITKASGDGGIDIIAHSKEHITGGKYIIQCKDWSKPVGEPPVRDLYGVVTAENANKGILITTSIFTAPAINFAAGKPLELIDGTKFNQLLAKYSLGSSPSVATADDVRIKVLTDQINKNPKNILVMKELADIYLNTENYTKAVELYSTIIQMKPSVDTERLKNAYIGALNNKAVALTKLKRYDDALKIFKESTLKASCMNEAIIAHYLELYDIAHSIYLKLKTIDGLDNWDEYIEQTYLQIQEDSPTLWTMISSNGKDELRMHLLDTPRIKSMKEGLYGPFIASAMEIEKEFLNSMVDLVDCIGPVPGSYDIEPSESYKKLFQLMYRSKELLSQYSHIINNATETPLQESCKGLCILLLEELKIIYEGLEKDISTLDAVKILFDEFNSVNLKKTEKQRELEIEITKAEDKYETIINQEKAEWREKLRNTLYANWTPQPSNTATPQPQNKQCFIATAVYGSPFSPEVEALRQWRDRSLSTTAIGRSFISSYYKYSPGIANFIKDRPFVKGLIKKTLDFTVKVVRG